MYKISIHNDFFGEKIFFNIRSNLYGCFCRRYTRFLEAKYKKNHPRSFVSVVYYISKGDAAFEQNMAGIKKALDFTVLRSMLGK